jgi:hypothetical protein
MSAIARIAPTAGSALTTVAAVSASTSSSIGHSR